MSAFTANQVSVLNNEWIVAINSGESISTINKGDFLHIANFRPVEINKTYVNDQGAGIIELTKPWKLGDQENQPAIVVPTTVDFKQTVQAMQDKNTLINDNANAMVTWQSELGTVDFKGLDGSVYTVKTLRQMEAENKYLEDGRPIETVIAQIEASKDIIFKNIAQMTQQQLPDGNVVTLTEGLTVHTRDAFTNNDGGGATFRISSTLDDLSSTWYALENGLYAILTSAESTTTASGFEIPELRADYVYPALDENQHSTIAGINTIEIRDIAGAYIHFQKGGVKIKSEISFNPSSTGTQRVGELIIPANVAQNMKPFTVYLQHTGLPFNTRVDIGLSATRTQERHRFKTLITSSENLAFEFIRDGATVIRAKNPNYFTELPDNGVGLVNCLGVVKLQVYVTLPEAVPDAEIQSVSMSIPRVSQKRKSANQISCTQRPFGLESAWNVRSTWKSRLPALTYNKDSMSGLHASGVAGETVITVADTTGVRVGDLVTICENRLGHYAPFNNYRDFVGYKYHKDTVTIIGAGVTVVSVDSDTQITISKPLLSDFNYSGVDYSTKTKFISTVTARHASCVAYGNGVWSKSPVTNKGGTGTINPYSGFVDSFKLNREGGETRPFTVKYQKWVATNGLVNEISGTNNYGEEVVNGQFIIDIPVDMDLRYRDSSRNSDKNVIIETPCGRFSIEMFYSKQPEYDSMNCSRISVIDKTYDSSVALYENKVKHSLATRAYGGSLVAGLITEEDLSKIPNPAFAKNDSELKEMLHVAESAIEHAIAVVPPITQLKSNSHSDGNFYSVTRTTNDVVFDSAGENYLVGDLIYTDPTANPHIEAACAMVTEIDSSGAVINAEWTVGGQLLQAVTESAPTITDSIGTGATFAASNFSESTGTDNQSIYPASVVDNAYASYNGALQMGDRLTIDPRIDLHYEWFEKIKNLDPEDFDLNPLHQYAAIWAIKRYGAIVCDVAHGTFLGINTSYYPYSTSLALERGGYNYPGIGQIMELLIPCDNSGYNTPNLSDIDVAIFK